MVGGKFKLKWLSCMGSSRSHLKASTITGSSVMARRSSSLLSLSRLNNLGMLSRASYRAATQTFSRTFATRANNLPSSSYTHASTSNGPATQGTPQDLSPSEREALQAALRVDQAGEIAANYIYQGQMAVLGRDKSMGPLISVSSPWTSFNSYAYTKHVRRICGSKKRSI